MGHAVRNFMPHLFISEFDRIKKRVLEMAEDIIYQVSQMEEIKTLQSETVTPVLEKVVKEHKFIQFAYVVDMEAHIITPFITQPDLTGKYKIAQIPSDFSDRSWFMRPIGDGKIHVSDFYVSYVTGVLCLTISAPIFGKGDRIVGILGFDIQFEDLVRAEDML
jgi:hypothetical protein